MTTVVEQQQCEQVHNSYSREQPKLHGLVLFPTVFIENKLELILKELRSEVSNHIFNFVRDLPLEGADQGTAQQRSMNSFTLGTKSFGALIVQDGCHTEM